MKRTILRLTMIGIAAAMLAFSAVPAWADSSSSYAHTKKKKSDTNTAICVQYVSQSNTAKDYGKEKKNNYQSNTANVQCVAVASDKRQR